MRIEEQKHQFNHTLHRKMWQWLSENPGKIQTDWPEYSKYFDTDITEFACMYAYSFTGYSSIVDCCYHRCPFPVNPASGEYRCYNGIYNKWACSVANVCWYERYGEESQNLLDEISKYAGMIKDLPLRTDIYISAI